MILRYYCYYIKTCILRLVFIDRLLKYRFQWEIPFKEIKHAVCTERWSFYTGDIYCSALCHPHLDTIAKSKTGINCVFGITISYYSLCMQYLMHTEEWKSTLQETYSSRLNPLQNIVKSTPKIVVDLLFREHMDSTILSMDSTPDQILQKKNTL